MHRAILFLLVLLAGPAARGEELAALATGDVPWRVSLPEENRREMGLDADWTGVAFVEAWLQMLDLGAAPTEEEAHVVKTWFERIAGAEDAKPDAEA